MSCREVLLLTKNSRNPSVPVLMARWSLETRSWAVFDASRKPYLEPPQAPKSRKLSPLVERWLGKSAK